MQTFISTTMKTSWASQGEHRQIEKLSEIIVLERHRIVNSLNCSASLDIRQIGSIQYN